jgi:hypothetical protein
MKPASLYLFAADLMLFAHLLFVAFVIFGLLLILVGRLREWQWVRNRHFRIAHLAAIAIVVLQSWFGVVCPLTTIEMALRDRAGDTVYEGTFISHWMESILYYRAPPWVFALCYTAFGLLVVASWFWVRPERRRSARRDALP